MNTNSSALSTLEHISNDIFDCIKKFEFEEQEHTIEQSIFVSFESLSYIQLVLEINLSKLHDVYQPQIYENIIPNLENFLKLLEKYSKENDSVTLLNKCHEEEQYSLFYEPDFQELYLLLLDIYAQIQEYLLTHEQKDHVSYPYVLLDNKTIMTDKRKEHFFKIRFVIHDKDKPPIAELIPIQKNEYNKWEIKYGNAEPIYFPLTIHNGEYTITISYLGKTLTLFPYSETL
ncbi:MAG: hypothetical protein NZZ41_04730 [Candidatus Dojkabacteria bacterium]|nr:hypothetical protein [Candidatus Dojkabacteria bacterium]